VHRPPAFALVALALTTLSTPALAESLSGTVYLEDGTTPAANAQVTLRVNGTIPDRPGDYRWTNRDVTLDETGGFTVDAWAGRVRVTVRVPGYNPASSDFVDLAEGADVGGIKVVLSGKWGTIRGTVYNVDDGRPLANQTAQVRLNHQLEDESWPSSSRQEEVALDAEGRYSIGAEARIDVARD